MPVGKDSQKGTIFIQTNFFQSQKNAEEAIILNGVKSEFGEIMI